VKIHLFDLSQIFGFTYASADHPIVPEELSSLSGLSKGAAARPRHTAGGLQHIGV
jgi:hypothetical protein